MVPEWLDRVRLNVRRSGCLFWVLISIILSVGLTVLVNLALVLS